MKTTIEKIIYPGKSLSRNEGKIIFTDEGLPGEEVLINPIKENKDYTKATTIEIFNPSPYRVKPRCTHYKTCSPYQYIDYEFQVNIKKEQVREIFLKQLKNIPERFTFRKACDIFNYRNKINLSLKWANEKPVFAYNLTESHNKYELVEECFLASKNINAFLGSVLKLITKWKLDFIEEVVVKESLSKNQMLLIIYCNHSGNMTETINELKEKFPLRGVIISDSKTGKSTIAFGYDFIEEKIQNRLFYIGAESFFQINIPMLNLLIEDMQRHALPLNNKIIADLYCGIGTFGIIFAKDTSKVIGVESDYQNIRFLKKNLEINNIQNFYIKHKDCKKWMASLKEGFDILIVDPPRKGLDEFICKKILESNTGTVFYISCNPATLARDLKILSEGYRVEELYAYDFFPQTFHIETLTILRKI